MQTAEISHAMVKTWGQAPHQDRNHGQSAVLDLLDLELSKVFGVVCESQRIKGATCIARLNCSEPQAVPPGILAILWSMQKLPAV